MSKSDYLALKEFVKSGAWVKVKFPNAFKRDVRLGYIEAEEIADNIGTMERCNYTFTPMLKVKWLQKDGRLILSNREVHFSRILEFNESHSSDNDDCTHK